LKWGSDGTELKQGTTPAIILLKGTTNKVLEKFENILRLKKEL